MSGTIKAGIIQHPDSLSSNITLNDDGSLNTGVVNASSVYANNMPGRNLLHNGAMQVCQRGTSTASITTSGYHTADRWYFSYVSHGTWTHSIENDAPTGSGFRKSLKYLCTTADASPAAGDLVALTQSIEGQNLQSVKKGTADAQPLTLSFWVKSNKTGTYVVELSDADNTRAVSATYTVNASATWEQKSITFPADTTGAFDNDNAGSLNINWWLGAGSDFSSGTLATSWAARVNGNRAVGQVNLASDVNNYWQITGVQLETGSVQTPYDHKDYGTELSECQRYYYRVAAGSGPIVGQGVYYSAGQLYVFIPLPVTMRSVPNFVNVTGTNYFACAPGGDGFNTLTLDSASTTSHVVAYNNTEANGSGGYGMFVYANNASTVVALAADL